MSRHHSAYHNIDSAGVFSNYNRASGVAEGDDCIAVTSQRPDNFSEGTVLQGCVFI